MVAVRRDAAEAATVPRWRECQAFFCYTAALPSSFVECFQPLLTDEEALFTYTTAAWWLVDELFWRSQLGRPTTQAFSCRTALNR
jgi:hypothetical protein